MVFHYYFFLPKPNNIKDKYFIKSNTLVFSMTFQRQRKQYCLSHDGCTKLIVTIVKSRMKTIISHERNNMFGLKFGLIYALKATRQVNGSKLGHVISLFYSLIV